MQITEELIRQLVAEVVDKIESLNSTSVSVPVKGEIFPGKVLTGTDIEQYFRRKILTLHIRPKTLLTPLATERARDLGVILIMDR
ncbi:MAG: hypothetical protein H3C47_05560 [Candidatus Cloacimonetes bacterium]|nr:hypothetical protein [Candidatus Cloacimonadota bacterium]